MSCPICANEMSPKYRPFCSRRCADIDLAKWMSGTYTIPAPLDDEAEEAALDASPDTRPQKPH